MASLVSGVELSHLRFSLTFKIVVLHLQLGVLLKETVVGLFQLLHLGVARCERRVKHLLNGRRELSRYTGASVRCLQARL